MYSIHVLDMARFFLPIDAHFNVEECLLSILDPKCEEAKLCIWICFIYNACHYIFEEETSEVTLKELQHRGTRIYSETTPTFEIVICLAACFPTRNDLLCAVRYKNNLPDVPFDPKFLSYPFDPLRSVLCTGCKLHIMLLADNVISSH